MGDLTPREVGSDALHSAVTWEQGAISAQPTRGEVSVGAGRKEEAKRVG